MEVLSAASPSSDTGGGDGDDYGDDSDMVMIMILTVMMVEMVTGLQPQIQLKKKKKKQDEPELTSAEFRSPVQGLAFIKCIVNVCGRMNEFTHCAESQRVKNLGSPGGWSQYRGMGFRVL